MHKRRFPCDATSAIFSTWQISGRMWFSSLCGSPWPQLAYSIISGNHFLSLIKSGCVSEQNWPYISPLSLWISQHLLRSRGAAWRLIDSLSSILGMTLPGNQNESHYKCWHLGDKSLQTHPEIRCLRWCQDILMLYHMQLSGCDKCLICGTAAAKSCSCFFCYLWFALFLILPSANEMSRAFHVLCSRWRYSHKPLRSSCRCQHQARQELLDSWEDLPNAVKPQIRGRPQPEWNHSPLPLEAFC